MTNAQAARFMPLNSITIAAHLTRVLCGQEIINRIDVKDLGRQLQVMKLSGTVPTGTSLVDEHKQVLGPLTSIGTLGETIGLTVYPPIGRNAVLSLGETGETAILMHQSANQCWPPLPTSFSAQSLIWADHHWMANLLEGVQIG